MKSAAYIERPNRPLRTYAILFLGFLYIPVLFLPLFSFNDSLYIAFPFKAFTTKWYAQMLANEPLQAALMNSIWVGRLPIHSEANCTFSSSDHAVGGVNRCQA